MSENRFNYLNFAGPNIVMNKPRYRDDDFRKYFIYITPS